MNRMLPIDNRDVLAARGPRSAVSPDRPYAYLVEPELSSAGRVEDVATVFITNRECPFRCLMCDLWRNTLTDRAAAGAVADQIEWALRELPYAPHVKLYNSGNFFDEQAVPRSDLPRIAEIVSDRRTVIVECHPRLVHRRCVDFSKMIAPAKLEVAMGLETVDPSVLPRLNKGMTLDHFACAAQFLLGHDINIRAFILLRPPFQSEDEGVHWAMRSIDFALSVGVECCAVIPTRSGNGIMERLQREGHFTPPSVHSLERVLQYGLSLGKGRVFADLWDIQRFFDCPKCGHGRAERMRRMNLTQRPCGPVRCSCTARVRA